jgi:hypothetical protein
MSGSKKKMHEVKSLMHGTRHLYITYYMLIMTDVHVSCVTEYMLHP